MVSLVLVLAIGLSCVLLPSTARADTPVTLFKSWAGNLNITGTAGTLRTNPDSINPCSVTNSGTMDLEGIPAGSTVVAAYLYWAGSGGGPGEAPADYNVDFNGYAVSADRTYTASYNAGGGDVLNFFGGVADVTSMIAGNGIYTFSGLSVQNTDINGVTYCSSQAVLSAFALVVVYSNPAESLHVVNLWEGLQTYRGGDIALSPTNFVVPNSNISGRHLVLTWEGDSGNSGGLNGYNENLTFCAPGPTCVGNPLTDAYNPLNNQFNSTVDVPPNGPFSGINTTWGVDLDMYDVSGYLHPGDSSAVVDYASGGDLVILANQTMSIANVAVADLAMSVSHSGNFTIGQNGVFTLGVTNNGPSDATGVTVTDTLPSGLSFVSAAGTGWSCSDAGQTVTCTQSGTIGSGSSGPPITLTTAVGSSVSSSVTDQASVSATTFDNVSSNNSASDTATVVGPNFSTSTKSWQDLNGGNQMPGDVLKYTITVKNTGTTATGVSVTDNIPANVGSFTVESIPTGATDQSTGAGTGANGNGYLHVTGITAPGGGSVSIVYEVTIDSNATAGTTINNSADISLSTGTSLTVSASPVTVTTSPPPAPSSGTKYLYLHDTASPSLSRQRPSVNANDYLTIPRGYNTQTWTLSPALAFGETISSSSGSFPVQLWLASNRNRNFNIPVTLSCGSTTVATRTLNNVYLRTSPQEVTFTLPLTSSYTCNGGQTWSLSVENAQGYGRRAHDIRVYPAPTTGNYSSVQLPSQTVVNVDSIDFVSDVAYPPGGTALTTISPGTHLRIRATVSDPFGAFDITSATLTLTSPTGTVIQVPNANWTQIYSNTPDDGHKYYEYAYTIPNTAASVGNWTASVTAVEGVETDANGNPLVTNTRDTTRHVEALPDLTVVKSVFTTQSDPVHGTNNPFAIPGNIMRYEVTVSNSGLGSPDAGSLDISDTIPGNTALIVSNPPVVFADGSPSSGVSFTYGGLSNTTDDVEFCAGSNCNYVPTVGANSTDPNVTRIKILPKGTMAADSGSGAPNFTVKFWVRIK